MHGASTNSAMFCLECLFHCTMWIWTQY